MPVSIRPKSTRPLSNDESQMAEAIKPQEASKLVAVLLKDMTTASLAGAACRHRWDICVKAPHASYQPLRNLDVLCLETGTVNATNPLQTGSIGIIIANNVCIISHYFTGGIFV
mgnify:CR=1 FL=1